MVYSSILTLAGLTLVLTLLTGSSLFSKGFVQSEPAAIYVGEERLISTLPARLKIPKINVDAHVEHVGLTLDGAVDAPLGPANVAWFELSPSPGEIGVSIIDGHFGWKDDLPAVFDDLHTLQKGDKIYVEDKDGTSITFAVQRTMIYNKGDDASLVFESNDNKSHLVLITCQGTWDKTLKGYSGRFVVFADRDTQ